MNNLLRFIVFLVFVVDMIVGYTYIVPGSMGKSKDRDDHCYHEQSKSLIKRGDRIITSECEEISCWNDYSIQINGCGTFVIDDPSCVMWERNFSFPYPKCCTEFNCVVLAKDFRKKIEDDQALNTNHL